MKCTCSFFKIAVLHVLFISVLLFIPLLVKANESLISLECPTHIRCDNKLTIPLIISNAPVINSFGIELRYSSQITFSNCNFQDCLTEHFDYIDCNSPETGRLKLGGFTTNHPIEEGSNGCLARLEFHVVDNCNSYKFWIRISGLFDELKGIETKWCPPPQPQPITTTTVPICTVRISPASISLNSRETQRFKALTDCNGDVVEGTYNWEISPASTIGSTINTDGLFVAGDNETGSAIQEFVRVTDSDHDNASDVASVTIKPKAIPIPECEVKITPAIKTIYTGEIIEFHAATTCDGEPIEGTYVWTVDSSIGSSIDTSGLYTSGHTDTDVVDTVRVVDVANGEIADTATIHVIGTFIEVWPDPMLRSHLFRLPVWIAIRGTNTHFDLTTTIHYTPSPDITPLFHLALGPKFLWGFALVNPQLSQTEPSPLTITVNTPALSEAVSDTITLYMLPWVLEKE